MGVEICVLILCAGAAVFDIRYSRIPNSWLCLWLGAAGAYSVLQERIVDFAAGGLVPLLLLGVFFYFRMLGAGDVKLFCVAGAWYGAENALWFLLAAFAAGAVISLIRMVRYPELRARFYGFFQYVGRFMNSRTKVEYGPGKDKHAQVHGAVTALVAAGVLLAKVWVW